mmetsp:Transcript_89969/g.178811  ORF Transcript_89969/g.178811 Transcript_89969/m.178811 type:complete len:258 (+) Transcript_89969:728-1501(+)
MIIDLCLQFLLLILEPFNGLSQLFNVIVEVFDVVFVLSLLVLAEVTVLDVHLCLFTEQRNHLVDCNNYLIEVPAGMNGHSEFCKAQAAKLRGKRSETLICFQSDCLANVGLNCLRTNRKLKECGARCLEGLLGIITREDLNCLSNTMELHGAESCALGPLGCPLLARLLCLRKELLIGLKLFLGVIKFCLAVSQFFCLLCFIRAALVQSVLKSLELRFFRLHEIFKPFLLLSLFGVSFFKVCCESIVHAFKNPLDLC